MSNKFERTLSFDEETYDEFFLLNRPPKTHDEKRSKLEEFCSTHNHGENRIVLVTSGGTTVPLEHNTVRFVDNFSLGTRGAASAEYFLEHGYAVLFVHRQRSLQPFVRHLHTDDILEALRICRPPDDQPDGVTKVEVTPEKVTTWLPTLERYAAVKSCGRLMSIDFTSLVEYVWLLRAAAEALAPFGPRAFLYLAAAVSDFYVPQEKMSTHKIHSDAALNIGLHLVPKMLKPLVRRWVPDAYIVSFKLETDEAVVIPKARAALHSYGHQLVIANLLQSRRSKVIFVGLTTCEAIGLSESESGAGVEIEERIVQSLVDRNTLFILQRIGPSAPATTTTTTAATE